MLKKVAKLTAVALAIGALITAQQFSGIVFGETTAPIAQSEKEALDQELNEAIQAKPHDHRMESMLKQILSMEDTYISSLENSWEAAQQDYKCMPQSEKSCDALRKHELQVRNNLIRASHVADAKMLPLFREFRIYLHQKDFDPLLADLVERHYEASKRALILHEIYE